MAGSAPLCLPVSQSVLGGELGVSSLSTVAAVATAVAAALVTHGCGGGGRWGRG